MSTSIQMGNDEFILYIRKNYVTCTKRNDVLGENIWKWIIKEDATARQVRVDVPCHWGDTAAHIGPTELPKTATQFRFDRKLLPSLYEHLDELGQGE
ncbi:MAG: hypothetical protein ABR907_09605 [Terracidiphilus sp.]